MAARVLSIISNHKNVQWKKKKCFFVFGVFWGDKKPFPRSLLALRPDSSSPWSEMAHTLIPKANTQEENRIKKDCGANWGSSCVRQGKAAYQKGSEGSDSSAPPSSACGPT